MGRSHTWVGEVEECEGGDDADRADGGRDGDGARQFPSGWCARWDDSVVGDCHDDGVV